MGRSRGGLTTKIHALVDAQGNPVTLSLTAGQIHDSRAVDDLLGPLRGDAGILLADKAYDSDPLRILAMTRNLWANVPSRSNRVEPIHWNAELYKKRNLIERFFNKIKHYRAIATRYDKNPLNYLAALKLIATRIWIRNNESTA